MYLLIFMIFFGVLHSQDYDRKLFGYDSRKARSELINTNQEIYDPYGNQYYRNARQLHVDHIVPLRLSWDLGAKNWTAERLYEFANDPDNLILVSASCNLKKGAKSLSEWLPKNKDFHSEYSNRYLFIIKKYGLGE